MTKNIDTNMNKNALISLAYYLPQFHEIEENNRWWGQGFTEWTQLNAAKTYFKEQSIRTPHQDIGQYHLLDKAVFAKQNHIAKQYGIDGFLVFDYWFGRGKRLLEQPMQLVLKEQLDFDYCLCWANHTWHNKRTNQVLIKQEYLGQSDYEAYFYDVLAHFKNPHYIRIAQKPVFAIFNPGDIPDLTVFMSTFERLAREAGFEGLFWIAENTDQHSPHANKFDRYLRTNSMFRHRKKISLGAYIREKLTRKLGFQQLGPFRYNYNRLMSYLAVDGFDDKTLPFVFAGWDTTPRHQRRGTWLTEFNPKTFAKQLQRLLPFFYRTANLTIPKIVIIKSWNEWAEGNVLEPDAQHGYAFLQAYADFVKQVNTTIQAKNK